MVPEVYWITARSCTAGFGCEGFNGSALTNFSHGIVPGAGWVSRSRVARSFLTGNCRASRFTVGNALSMFTETMCSRARSSGIDVSLATAASQQMATRAAWSSKRWRSSRSV